MEIVAIVLSLFSIAVSITTFIATMAIMTKNETGKSIFTIPQKAEDTPNNTADNTDVAELENFTPNFTKPVTVKFL